MKQCWIIAIGCVIFAGLSECSEEDLCIPPNLMIGASTAAYQVEGAWNVSGKAESVWDRMVHTQPETIIDGTNGDIACDSYHKYKKDVQRMKSIGLDFHRFSISWTRIIKPGCGHKVNEAGIQHYRDFVTELINNKIVPIVTIFHWDQSQYHEDMGGWTNPKMIDYYLAYARVLFRRLGDKVKIWQTVNEPNVFCSGAYSGVANPHLAPGKDLNLTGMYLCMHNILKAHALAYHMYDKEFRPTQDGEVGIGPNCPNFIGADPKDTVSPETEQQFTCGWVYHPIYHGDYPEIMKKRVAMVSKAQGCEESALPEFSQKWIKLIKGTADFFGVNHYHTMLCAPDPAEKQGIYTTVTGVIQTADPNWTISSAPWLYNVPRGLGDLMRWIKKEYNNPPVRIMENGWANTGGLNDYDRIDYYYGHMRSLLKAIKHDHCDVRSFSMWSVLDNFEWNDGYTQKFGIVSVDFDDPERTRREKLSAAWWRKVLKTRQLQPVPTRPRFTKESNFK